MPDLWDKLPEETPQNYEAFLLYLESPTRDFEKIAKKAGVTGSTVRIWAKKYNWIERALAYDNHKSELLSSKREKLIEEHAYSFVRELENRIKMLLLSSGIYMKRLKEGGLKELERLPLRELRNVAMEDLDMLKSYLRTYRDFIDLTPEGRAIKQSELASDKIQIVINSAEAPKIEVNSEVIDNEKNKNLLEDQTQGTEDEDRTEGNETILQES